MVGDANWWPSKTPRQLLALARANRAAAADDVDHAWFDEHGDADTGPIHSGRAPDDGGDDDDVDTDDGYATAVRTASTVRLAWGDRDDNP
jgi:hypothetical protein